MKADHLTYTRAAGVAFMGLVLQLVLGLILLIYGILGRDHAAQSAGVFVLLGLPVWLTLAVLFDQHRRERLEALEAESLDAQDARRASVFEGTGADDLRVAARRLAWLHRFLVPGMSLTLGAVLVAVGLWRFTSGRALTGFDVAGVDQFPRPALPGWGISLGLGIAVIGFVFARFVSGMAKQRVWANLRGGAAYAVVASLAGLALALAHFVDLAGSDLPLRYLQVVIPAGMVLVGVEIFLTFLLTLYRPRKPGEVPRAAFDSPLLSFVASPDQIARSLGEAISYQFGVDVTGSWAYRRLSEWALRLVLLGVAALWLMTCFVVVGPNERGLLIARGAFGGVLEPGLHVKAPWPLASVERISATAHRSMDLANPRPKADTPVILWTNAHAGGAEETYAIVQPTAVLGQAGGGDLALVKIEVPLHYNIADPEKFERFAAPRVRDDLIKAIAQREVFAHLATLNEDDLIGAGRAAAGRVLQERVGAALDRAGAGVSVLYLGVEAAHPPQQNETAKKYEEVVSTEQRRERLLELASAAQTASLVAAAGSVEKAREIVAAIDGLADLRGRKAPEADIAAAERAIEQMLITAGGRAGQLLARAAADRWTTVLGARARSEAFAGQRAAYQAAPAVYRTRLYFDMMADLIKDARVYVVDDRSNLWPQVDLKELGSGGDVLSAQPANP